MSRLLSAPSDPETPTAERTRVARTRIHGTTEERVEVNPLNNRKSILRSFAPGARTQEVHRMVFSDEQRATDENNVVHFAVWEGRARELFEKQGIEEE